MPQPEVVMYSTPTDAYSAAARRWFKEHGVAYTEYDVSRDPARAAEIYRVTGQNAVPVIRVGGQVLIGFDPLQLAKLIPFSTGTNGGAAPGERLSLGMSAQSLSAEKAAEVGLPAAFGVLVGQVKPGGVADLAGLKEDDIIVGVGDYTLQNLKQLQNIVAAKRPGDTLAIRVYRGGEELPFTIAFPAEDTASAADQPGAASEPPTES